MSEDYEQRADAADGDIADMEQRSERVGEQIEATRKDWEEKVSDPDVPGAGGDPQAAEAGGRHPETAVTSQGPSDEATTEDPTDNDRGVVDAPGGDRGRIPGEAGGGDD
jgi:hypothetical protein